MHISGHDDLFTFFYMRKNHRLNSTRRAIYHHKCMRGAKCIRHKLLSFLDNGNRMTEIIQRFHGINIYPNTSVTQKTYQFRVSSSPLMPRYIKRYYPLLAKFFKSVINRRFLLSTKVQLPFLLPSRNGVAQVLYQKRAVRTV